MKKLLLCLALALPLAAAPSIDDLKWLSGHWTGTIDGVQMEEIWSEPAGGIMIGMHRDVRPNRSTFFEFFRIAETKDAIVYYAQPAGRPPTPFKLTESSKERVVFANPENDFPKRIIYVLHKRELCARIEGDGNAAEQWCWSRRSAN
ncbi:MAG TPA: DUF6265 family protein [Thermoanaerobaculia bacterium]|jgi:hypothetical protein